MHGGDHADTRVRTVSAAHARVFSETSVWMAVPLAAAACSGKHLLASALLLTMVASRQHWRVLAERAVADALWHNLDRLGVVLVLAHVDRVFWPPLALLFAAGAALQRMRVQTCVFGGGAGRAKIPVWPLRARRWHYRCHLLCRYVAFFACCFASGHLRYPQLRQHAPGKPVDPAPVLHMLVYSGLYLAHIRLASSR